MSWLLLRAGTSLILTRRPRPSRDKGARVANVSGEGDTAPRFARSAGSSRPLKRCSLVYRHVLGVVFVGKFSRQAFEVGTDKLLGGFRFAATIAAIELGC